MDINSEKLEFMRTSEGRIGVGLSTNNEGDSTSFTVLKWCPESLLVDMEKEILVKSAVNALINTINK